MESLPNILPVLKVRSTILMPHAQLPIIISENDYLKIAAEIIENNIVAIIQPRPNFVKASNDNNLINVFNTGCAGKITNVSSIEGDIAINIRGVCRFDKISDIPPDENDIERIVVSYDRYQIDMEPEPPSSDIDKNKLLNVLDIYFKNLEISPNWREIEKTPIDALISALVMACPLTPSEKQSLLEMVSIKERSDMIMKIIEMNSFDKLNTANTIN
jgi:Lon protease-like protein